MAQITINEGLAWLKTLKKRHEELLALRNDNAHRERRFYGASADKEIVKDSFVGGLWRDRRWCGGAEAPTRDCERQSVVSPDRGPLAFPSRRARARCPSCDLPHPGIDRLDLGHGPDVPRRSTRRAPSPSRATTGTTGFMIAA